MRQCWKYDASSSCNLFSKMKRCWNMLGNLLIKDVGRERIREQPTITITYKTDSIERRDKCREIQEVNADDLRDICRLSASVVE